MISGQDLVGTVSFEQSQVHDNMIVAEQNISSNIGIDTTNNQVKEYGCYIIKMSELTILNEHGLQTSILNDNKLEIDDSKISNILISCAKIDNQTMVLRENMLKEYFILTMNKENPLLVDGRICSFLNSSCRTIIVNYMLEKGMKFYNQRDTSVDKEIILKSTRENRSISRKLKTSMYNVYKFVVEYIRDPSKPIDDLSTLDKTLIITWRSLNSFINPIMIGAFIKSIDEAQPDDKRSYIKTTFEEFYFRRLNSNNPSDTSLIISQNDSNTEIKGLTESFQNSSFWVPLNSSKREAQQRISGLTSNPSSPLKKKYKRSRNTTNSMDDIISPIERSPESEIRYESPTRYKQSGDQQSSNSLFSSSSKHDHSSDEEQQQQSQQSQQQQQEEEEEGEEEEGEEEEEEATEEHHHQQQQQHQEEEGQEHDEQQQQQQQHYLQHNQEQQQDQEEEQQQQEEEEEEKIYNVVKTSEQCFASILKSLLALDLKESNNFVVNSMRVESKSDSDDSDSYDNESVEEELFFCNYNIEDIKKGLCVNLIYLITNNQSQFFPAALVVDTWIERGGDNALAYYKLANQLLVCEELSGVKTSHGDKNTSILIDVKHKKYTNNSILPDMIFRELSYDDLYSYYNYNVELNGVPSRIFDLFFTILNIDIQNNYDRKGIILPLHFMETHVYKINSLLSTAVIENLKHCESFYIPVHSLGIVGLLILQFKSINATAMLYYFQIFPYYEPRNYNPSNKYLSPGMKRIINDFIMPFFLKIVFPRNAIKLNMLNSVVIKCIPKFTNEFLNNMQLPSMNKQNYELYLLLTMSAHLIACIDLGNERHLENNLQPVENNLWCNWENMDFLDKVSNIILYVVINKALPDYKL